MSGKVSYAERDQECLSCLYEETRFVDIMAETYKESKHTTIPTETCPVLFYQVGYFYCHNYQFLLILFALSIVATLF